MRIKLIFNIRFYLLLFVLFSIPFFVPGSPLIKDAEAGTYKLVRSVRLAGGNEYRTLSTKITASGVPFGYTYNAIQGYAFDAPGPDLIELYDCWEEGDDDYHPCTPQSSNWSDPRLVSKLLIGYIYKPNISMPPNAQPIYRCHHRYIDDDDSTGGNIKDGDGFSSLFTVIVIPGITSCDWSNPASILDEKLGFVLKTPFSVDEPQPSCSSLQPVLTVTWERYSTATYYKVFRVDPSTAPNGVSVGSDIPQVPVGQTPSFPDTGPDNSGGLIQAGQDYAYRVKAFNASGPIAGIDDTGPYFNSVPMCVSAPVQSCVGPNPNLKVQWSHVSGAAYYRIRRDDFINAFKVGDNWTQTSFKDDAQANVSPLPSHLITNSNYSYRIIAKDGAGVTLPNQNVISSPQKAGACAPPVLNPPTIAQDCTSGSPVLKVQWIDATNMVGNGSSYYKVHRKVKDSLGNFVDDPNFTDQIIMFPSATFYDDPIPISDVGKTYKYEVTAYNDAGFDKETTPAITVALCPIIATCINNPSSLFAGPSVSATWTAKDVKGGTGNYTYDWADPTNSNDPLNSVADTSSTAPQTGSSVSASPYSLAGIYKGQVTIKSPGVADLVQPCGLFTLGDNTAPIVDFDLPFNCYTPATSGNNPWPGSFIITAYDNESPTSVTVSTVGVRVKDGGTGYSDTCESSAINGRDGGCACSNNNQCIGGNCGGFSGSRSICYRNGTTWGGGLCENAVGRPDGCDCTPGNTQQCAAGVCPGAGTCGFGTGTDNYTGGSWWLNSGVTYNWSGEQSAPTGLTSSTGAAGNDYTVPFPYNNFKTPASHSEFKNKYTFRAEATSLGGTKTVDRIFDIKNSCTFPYLQTTGGDVHSNEDIKQP